MIVCNLFSEIADEVSNLEIGTLLLLNIFHHFSGKHTELRTALLMEYRSVFKKKSFFKGWFVGDFFVFRVIQKSLHMNELSQYYALQQYISISL